MKETNKKARGLGRGLSALFGEEDLAALAGEGGPSAASRPIAIDLLHPNLEQPRRHYDEAALQALAQSITRQGVLQPLVVRPHPKKEGHFEIVAGERRWRAAQQAKLAELPALVRELDDRTTLEIALVENVQREDLTPLEEAEAYRRLMEDFGHGQAEIGQAVGKSRSHIANSLRLLSLPDPIKALVTDGKLTAGHARALLTADNPLALAEAAVAEGWSVREMERRAQQSGSPRPVPGRSRATRQVEKDADTRALEEELALVLGLKVALMHHGSGGHLTLHYENLEQLDDVISRLRREGTAF
ncbi:MAG: ParB/RepB/Spo0J family partition protein [Rhodospirillales bacterium]